MLKKLEAWLRRIFGGELTPFRTDLAALETRLSLQLTQGLADIEARLAKQLNARTNECVEHFADELAAATRRLDHKILETQNLINHNRATPEEVAADHQLRHPRHKR